MRKLNILSLCFVLAFGFAGTGCDKKEETKPSKPTAAKQAPQSPVVATSGQEGSGEAGLPLDQLPSKLKHKGFEYIGLQELGPIEFEVTTSPGGSSETLISQTKLVSIKDGAAIFQTRRTGGPAEMVGVEEVVLRADGVYTTKLNEKPLTPPQLQVPADFGPGKAWNSDGSMELDGHKVQQKVRFRTVGFESVKTKAGTFDAAKVVAEALFQVDGKKSKSKIVGWYVKGLGTLKMIVTAPDKTITVEATKVP